MAPIMKPVDIGMCSLLRRHSVRLVFALLCVLVLTRLPPVGLAEDAWSSSIKIEDAVASVAQVPSCTIDSTIDVNVASATIVFFLASRTAHPCSTPDTAEHSILRL
jgi:hypothetical protein